MRDIRAALLTILFAFLTVSGVGAQDSIIAPNIFVRGMQLPQGVRYSAAFVKPSDDTILRNVSVEMTLPGDAVFLEMLISRQIEFDVIRRSPQKQLTLIWQISRISTDQALDSFSFTVAHPLTEAVEFYMQWQDENGELHVENFFERPIIVDATQSEQTVTLTQASMQMLGATGIQIAPPANALPLSVTARVLSSDFNPPPEYGDLWWCSLLALEGLPAGTAASVIVPLRRPVAPFTALAMFQQQADRTWRPLETQAIVTADGQYAQYIHSGGVVATGGPEEIQQTPLSAEKAVIVDVATEPDPAPVIEAPVEVIQIQAPLEPVAAPIDAIVVVPIEPEQPPIQPTQAPVISTSAPVEPPQIPPTSASITDGSSNTIIVGENPRPTLAPVVNTLAPVGTKKTNGITTVGLTSTPSAGSSNVIVVGGITSSSPTPTLLPFLEGSLPTSTLRPPLAGITDGSSNTILFGEATSTATSPSPAPVATGKGGAIIIGGVNLTPTLLPFLEGSLSTPTLRPPLAGITDGSSNTILFGEATHTAVPSPAPFATGKGGAIIVGGITSSSPTPTLLPTLGSTSPTLTPPLRSTLAGITDGSSNTILFGEATRTVPPLVTRVPPTATRVPTLIPTTVSLSPGVIVNPPPLVNPIQPFGGGGTRVEIVAVSIKQMTQCSAGSVNCAIIVRVLGKGKR